jgi:hypothetical protein
MLTWKLRKNIKTFKNYEEEIPNLFLENTNSDNYNDDNDKC